MLKVSAKDQSKFEDQSRALDSSTLALVQAALRASLSDPNFSSFTTPTSEFDEGRIEWAIRRWMGMKSGKPSCFLVAYQVANAHFEIIGPEVQLPK